MQNSPLRGFFGLVAIAAATAVGVTTHDAGFTALTFVGALVVPRVLGLTGHRGHGFGCAGRHEGRDQMRKHLEQRLEDWHGKAHGSAPADSPQATSPTVA